MTSWTRVSETLWGISPGESGRYRLPPATAALCQTVRIGIVGLIAWKWFDVVSFSINPAKIAYSMRKWQDVDVSGLSDAQVFGLLSLNVVFILLLHTAIYLSLFQLFTGFLRGEVFTRGAGVWLRRAGLFELAFVVAGPLRATLATALLTAHLPEGPHWLAFWLNADPLYDFVIGGIGFVLGQAFIAAADMAEDNAQIV